MSGSYCSPAAAVHSSSGTRGRVLREEWERLQLLHHRPLLLVSRRKASVLLLLTIASTSYSHSR
jgi:hypothetical protein